MRHFLLAGMVALFASCSGVGPEPPLTPDQALDLIAGLPEVSFRTRGEVKILIMIEGEPAPGIWDIYVGENHETHTARSFAFQVDSQTRRVEVWDYVLDGYVALETWRARSHR